MRSVYAFLAAFLLLSFGTGHAGGIPEQKFNHFDEYKNLGPRYHLDVEENAFYRVSIETCNDLFTTTTKMLAPVIKSDSKADRGPASLKLEEIAPIQVAIDKARKETSYNCIVGDPEPLEYSLPYDPKKSGGVSIALAKKNPSTPVKAIKVSRESVDSIKNETLNFTEFLDNIKLTKAEADAGALTEISLESAEPPADPAEPAADPGEPAANPAELVDPKAAEKAKAAEAAQQEYEKEIIAEIKERTEAYQKLIGEIRELKDTVVEVSVEPAGWQLEFAGAFTSSFLTDPKYGLTTNADGDQVVTRFSNSEDKVRLGMAGFIHITNKKWLEFWPPISGLSEYWVPFTFGLGINQDSRVNYFIGTTIRLAGKAYLTFGQNWGSVKTLPIGLREGSIVQDGNALNNMGDRIAGGFFMAVSYSFASTGEGFFKAPFTAVGNH